MMASQKKKRVPLQVSPEFNKMLKNLQRKVVGKGVDKSLRDLTDDMAKTPSLFDEMEKKILNKKNLVINVKFDIRK